MTLHAWLKTNGKTLEWLAEQLDCSVTSAHRLTHGLQNAPMSTLDKIEKLTGGEVTSAEMLAAFREAQGEADAA